MRYLLYCVFPWGGGELAGAPLGVERQPVFVVPGGGVGAAVSQLRDPEPALLDISCAVACASVVEWFHRRRTVIPARYGCVFEEYAQIVRLLEERREAYWSLLRELDGLVEMGIRVLLEREERPACSPPQLSGTAYLAARRDHYAALDRMASSIQGRISGLFVRSRQEWCAGSSLLSLYFLVPKDSAELFSQAVRRLARETPGKLLLSGPWPPYNFVEGRGAWRA